MAAAISFTPSVVSTSPAPRARSKGGAAPSLAMLRKLASYADTPDAAPDLRAHLLAHLETYAPLFGVSTARLASAVAEAGDDTLASHVNGSIGVALAQAKEAKENATALERDAAAARVSASLQFDPGAEGRGGYTLDREAVLECTDGARNSEGSFVRFVPREGDALDVGAYRLRAILKLKPDARVTLVPRAKGAPALLVVRWGNAGRMRFRAEFVELRHKDPLTTIPLPAVARLDGGPADVVQGCENQPCFSYGGSFTLRGASKEETIAYYAAQRAFNDAQDKRRECDYERSERARLNNDQTFRIAPLPEPPAMPSFAPRKERLAARAAIARHYAPPPPPPVLTVPPVPVDAFERAASSRVIHVAPYPMPSPLAASTRPAGGPAVVKAAHAAPSPPPPSGGAPGGKTKRREPPSPPPAPPSRGAIYTYGYAGRSPAELVELARTLRATVIDVRGVPESRATEWRRASLESTLGARYQWRGTTLGNKGAHRTTEAGLASLASLTSPAILLCGCAIPAECHRHQKIGWPLIARGAIVRHVYPASLDERGALGLRVVTASELQRAIDDGDSYECFDLADIVAEL